VSSAVVIPLATIEPARAEAALLETGDASARAQVIPAQLFKEFLLAVHYAHTAAHLRFGGISPSSACY